MSFVGITFPNQKVTPSADALLMQNILSDGILQGCKLSTTGFTLTMEAGGMILCGRNIQHTAAESWAVNGASSGFARLVITIDLSKSATVDAFDQIEASIEYASTANGFPAMEKSEINVSGVKYQAEFCVVSLSSGGITGIVRQLPGATLCAESDLLTKLLSAGYMQLSGYQIVDALPDPAGLPEGTFMLVPIQKVN